MQYSQDFALYHFQVDFNYSTDCLLHLMQMVIILFSIFLFDFIAKYLSSRTLMYFRLNETMAR